MLRGPFLCIRGSATAVPLPGGRSLELGERTLVMGILNITPDSFADGGVHYDVDRAVEAGLRMVAEGADILDIGGESTRPGAEQVGAEEEMRSVLPVIERLAREADVPLSIDTYKASVAREAIGTGRDDHQRHQRAALRS